MSAPAWGLRGSERASCPRSLSSVWGQHIQWEHPEPLALVLGGHPAPGTPWARALWASASRRGQPGAERKVQPMSTRRPVLGSVWGTDLILPGVWAWSPSVTCDSSLPGARPAAFPLPSHRRGRFSACGPSGRSGKTGEAPLCGVTRSGVSVPARPLPGSPTALPGSGGPGGGVMEATDAEPRGIVERRVFWKTRKGSRAAPHTHTVPTSGRVRCEDTAF